MFNKILCLIPLVGASSSIYFVSAIPHLSLPDLGFRWEDKLFHSIAYFIYGVTVSVALAPWFERRTRWKVLLLAILVGLGYAASDEFHQSLVAGRKGDLLDWIADAIGIVTSQIFFNRIVWLLHRVRILK